MESYDTTTILWQNNVVYEQTEYWTEKVPRNTISFFDVFQIDNIAELVDDNKAFNLPEVTVAYSVRAIEKEQTNYRKFNFSRPPPPSIF